MKVSNTILVSLAAALLTHAAPAATEANVDANALEAKPITQELFFGGGGGGHHHHHDSDCYYDDYYDDGWAVKRDAVPPQPSSGTTVAAAARSSDKPADLKINFKYKEVDDETYHSHPHHSNYDNQPQHGSHSGQGRRGRHGHVVVPGLEGDFESTADAFWNQERSNAFVLEVRQPKHYLNGNMIFTREDGTLALQDHGLGHFVGVIGEESDHLFSTKVQKPIGIVGALNTLQVVGDMRFAARPWGVNNGVLTVNGESHAVACPTDPEQTYYQLHWGDETLCPGGVPIDLVTKPANHQSPAHRQSSSHTSHHSGHPSKGHSNRHSNQDHHRHNDEGHHSSHHYDDEGHHSSHHHDDEDEEDWEDHHRHSHYDDDEDDEEEWDHHHDHYDESFVAKPN